MPTKLRSRRLVLAKSSWLLCATALLAALAIVDLPPRAAAQAVLAENVPSIKVGALVIDMPWIRATPPGAKAAAGYLKITNTGKEPDRLIGGLWPLASAVEVHEMSMAGGVMKMRKLENGLEIKPGQTVELSPGGYHLMLTGLQDRVREGKPIKVTLNFEKSGSVDVEFAVAPIGSRTGGHMMH